MLIEMSHPYFIMNGKIEKCDNMINDFNFQGKILYEVIRVIGSSILFLEGHLNRLGRSILQVQGQKISMSKLASDIEKSIYEIIRINEIKDNNVKVLIGNFTGSGYDLVIHANPSYYPPCSLYASGVDTCCVYEERESPNVKAVNDNLADKIAKIKEQTGIFEALLVNKAGNITEGSKSNIFFTGGNVIITPCTNTVLPGITRSEVIKSATEIGIEVIEKNVGRIEATADGSYIDTAFLTGTSLHILPIRKIDDRIFKFDENDTLKRLMEAFDKKVRNAIKI